MFSEGREDVNDEEHAGRPSTSTTDEKINEVEKMILANRRITVREVAEDLNISIGSCHSIFINDLGMRRVAANFVPKLLNCDQKQHRMNIANEMLDSVRDDPNLLQMVITSEEAWVYGYDVETKAQSSQWKLPHEPRPKKARQVRSNVKVLLTVFFDCRGLVHHEFLPQGRTVNKEYYLQVIRNLREAIRQKLPDLWKNKNWLLHHENAPAHSSLLVDEVAGVTHLKTKMILVDGSLRYTCKFHCLRMEADAEQPGLKIQGLFAGSEHKRENYWEIFLIRKCNFTFSHRIPFLLSGSASHQQSVFLKEIVKGELLILVALALEKNAVNLSADICSIPNTISHGAKWFQGSIDNTKDEAGWMSSQRDARAEDPYKIQKGVIYIRGRNYLCCPARLSVGEGRDTN
ncbi:hypothetical protein LAZ67_18002221 [Cordylochernes scorpioides]|uniref:Transposase n=1 Tax=Cordylochernes scorpioides TaxID=51811 RepID=A0ABY6LGE4_9ARAC|nr:hypothetical protein LAZ67_18002221 [Cordylochernes scorpioides]